MKWSLGSARGSVIFANYFISSMPMLIVSGNLQSSVIDNLIRYIIIIIYDNNNVFFTIMLLS